jgi:hypothetical protein
MLARMLLQIVCRVCRAACLTRWTGRAGAETEACGESRARIVLVWGVSDCG